MNANQVRQARRDYCFGRSCHDCAFKIYARDKFNTCCGDLMPYQIYEILQFIKEDKPMTNEEALRKEIDETMKQLDILQKKLEEVKNGVPDTLNFGACCYVDEEGCIQSMQFGKNGAFDNRMAKKHRLFNRVEYAETFEKKTQFIADMLHFKYLYDTDYKPDWSNIYEPKWYIYHANKTGRYEIGWSLVENRKSDIYFSSEEIAKKCAEWLNKKYGYTKE